MVSCSYFWWPARNSRHKKLRLAAILDTARGWMAHISFTFFQFLALRMSYFFLRICKKYSKPTRNETLVIIQLSFAKKSMSRNKVKVGQRICRYRYIHIRLTHDEKGIIQRHVLAVCGWLIRSSVELFLTTDPEWGHVHVHVQPQKRRTRVETSFVCPFYLEGHWK